MTLWCSPISCVGLSWACSCYHSAQQYFLVRIQIDLLLYSAGYYTTDVLQLQIKLVRGFMISGQDNSIGKTDAEADDNLPSVLEKLQLVVSIDKRKNMFSMEVILLGCIVDNVPCFCCWQLFFERLNVDNILFMVSYENLINLVNFVDDIVHCHCFDNAKNFEGTFLSSS